MTTVINNTHVTNGHGHKDSANPPLDSYPALLKQTDFQLLDSLSNFNREKIPERAVHAKGAGAYGTFELTDDVSDLCDIDMLKEVGKKTECVVRFSTTALERGSAESIRDTKGMAIKFFTDEGNWDWVCLNIPIFFIRDPAKFPVLMHAQRRDPQTNRVNPSNWWEWVCNNHESLHMVLFQYSEFGTMFSWQGMSGYSNHAFKWVKIDGSWKYIHFLILSDQGPRMATGGRNDNVSPDPDAESKALHEAIEKGNYPTWTASLQVIDPKEAPKLDFNILDLTKHWPLANYPKEGPFFPYRDFGKLTLNRNPVDYHSEIEQLAFSPSHLVPGVEPSEDPMLQARLFAYPDAQRYRLGANNLDLPANRPKSKSATTNPPSRLKPEPVDPERAAWLAKITSSCWSEVSDIDYRYPREFWNVLPTMRSQEFQDSIVVNISESVAGTSKELREKVYKTLLLVAADLSDRVREATEKIVTEKGNGKKCVS